MSNKSAADKYREKLEARNATRKAEEPKVIPNFAEASATYNPQQDPPKTLSQLGEAQRMMGGEEPATFSQATIDGLARIKAAAEEEAGKAQAGATQPEPPPLLEKTEDIKAILDGMDSLTAGNLKRRIEEDVINNKAEREAVEAKIAPMDLTQGILNNEFTQLVPIVPGVLVTYRSVSKEEDMRMRSMIFDMTVQDSRVEIHSDDLYGVMLIVATVAQINTKQWPRHMVGTSWDAEFDPKLFQEKLRQFMRMPMPLLHALGVHGGWFDVRVRRLFTATSLKNG